MVKGLRKGAKGRWDLLSRRFRAQAPGPDPDPAVLELTAPLRAATETYLNTFATVLGTIAIVAATSNIVGGFIITDRMLRMFKVSRAPKPRT